MSDLTIWYDEGGKDAYRGHKAFFPSQSIWFQNTVLGDWKVRLLISMVFHQSLTQLPGEGRERDDSRRRRPSGARDNARRMLQPRLRLQDPPRYSVQELLSCAFLMAALGLPGRRQIRSPEPYHRHEIPSRKHAQTCPRFRFEIGGHARERRSARSSRDCPRHVRDHRPSSTHRPLPSRCPRCNRPPTQLRFSSAISKALSKRRFEALENRYTSSARTSS
jgi:hypothetical protein